MITYIIAGIVTLGFTTILTIAGLGAAFILIPVLVALGVPLLTAMSTALLLNSIAMIIASVSYAKENLIVFKTAIPIAIVTLVFSPLGANTATYMPENILTALFIAFLLFAATMMIFYKPKEKQQKVQQEKVDVAMQRENGTIEMKNVDSAIEREQEDIDAENHNEDSPKKLIGYGVIIGTVAGFVGGLLGVGGGNLIVPILIFLGFEAKRAAATTAFIVVFSSFSGFLAHISMGNINPWLLLFCAIGSVLGAILGARLMINNMSAKQVKIAIGIVLYLVAANMIYDLMKSAFTAV